MQHPAPQQLARLHRYSVQYSSLNEFRWLSPDADERQDVYDGTEADEQDGVLLRRARYCRASADCEVRWAAAVVGGLAT
jgi:hypothetical protein